MVLRSARLPIEPALSDVGSVVLKLRGTGGTESDGLVEVGAGDVAVDVDIGAAGVDASEEENTGGGRLKMSSCSSS